LKWVTGNITKRNEDMHKKPKQLECASGKNPRKGNAVSIEKRIANREIENGSSLESRRSTSDENVSDE